MRLTRHSETVTIEGSVAEIRALFGKANIDLPDDIAVDPQTLTLNDDRRYRGTGRIGNYGERECIDIRTGRRGTDTNAFGFIPGAYVTSDGRMEFEHPWDNPLQGCRW